MANIGEQLSQPENGWARYKYNHDKFIYTNYPSWSDTTRDSLVIGDGTCAIYFKGDKLRILSEFYSDRGTMTISIDDTFTTEVNTNGNLILNCLAFEKVDLKDTVHKLIISTGTGISVFTAIDINEDGYLLSEEEAYEEMLNKHLIKSDGKFYTIEENNLVEITEEITSDLIKNRGISVNILTANQSLLPDKFKLVSHKDNTFNINSIKSKKELVVASNDFITTIQSNIDFFGVVGITDTGTSIKVVFSIDNGITWKSYDTQFKDLSITIPNKPYEELTEEELVQWNNARDVISEQGIDIANLSKIDFNTLNMEKIRFAYVLSINSKDDKCCTSQLKWQFDSKGTMKSMTSDELEIELLQDSIKVTPKINSEMIKVNFTNGAGNDNDSIETDIDDNIISEDKTWSSQKINNILNTNTPNKFTKVIEESEFQDITEGENEGFFKVNIIHGLNCSGSFDLVVLNEYNYPFDLGVFCENINQNDFDLISYAKQKMTITVIKMNA